MKGIALEGFPASIVVCRKYTRLNQVAEIEVKQDAQSIVKLEMGNSPDDRRRSGRIHEFKHRFLPMLHEWQGRGRNS